MTVIGANGTAATGTGLVGQANAQPFTVDSDCAVTDIELLSTYGGFNSSDVVGIASAVAGSISWLGKYTVPGFLAASATWRTFTLDATANLDAGTTYYLVNVSTAGANQITRGALQMSGVVNGLGSGVLYGAPGYASTLTNQQTLFRLIGTIDPVLAVTASDNLDGTVTLAIVEAEHAGSVVYTSDFSAGVDSWTSGTDGVGGSPSLLAPATAPSGSTPSLRAGITPVEFDYADQYLRRTVTGLTNGLTYRVTATLQKDPAGFSPFANFKIGKTGDLSTGTSVGELAPVTISHDFVAVGTSDDIEIRNTYGSGNDGCPHIWDVTVTLVPTGLEPLTIQRTDANGTRYVRLAAGAEPDAAGALSVIDAEPATAGLVTYVVRDGGGNTASDSLTLDHPTPVIHAVGYTVTLDVDRVDGYEGSRRYQVSSDVLPIVGRQDPITTERGEATWSLRRGTLTFAPQPTFAEADAIRVVYTSGRVVMLRQATHVGLDLYHVALEIQGPTPVYLADAGWRWQVRVTYVEVSWPAGDLRGDVAWDYAGLEDSALAYWNLGDDWSTYADLEAGP